MTPERFSFLTETYGSDPRRWPEAERDAASVFAQTHPAEARRALEAAAFLDQELDGYRVAPPDLRLRERIVAAAPYTARRARVWWQGLGFAGLGLAGALAGALMVAVIMPMHTQDEDDAGAYAVTAFSDVPDEGDE